MTPSYITQTIFFSSLVFVFAGLARADNAQCGEGKGKAVYIQAPCQSGDDIARNSALTDSSAISPKVSSRSDRKAREVAWVNDNGSNSTIGLDVRTVKAARSSMLSMDQASSLLRQQELATSLDQKNQRWFSF